MKDVEKILIDAGALMEGHFLLSSGKHSPAYIQCAKLFQNPRLSSQVMSVVANKLAGVQFDLLCGPAMGGVIASYELARQLDMESIFTERKDGQMSLRRGFTIQPGQKVLIVEDVVTTGKSSLECRDVIEENGGQVIGIACVVNRSGRDNVGLPIYAACQINIDTYDEDEVPEWLTEIPITQPGSRDFKKG